MGSGDNLRGASENALRDLAGLSEPTDDAHVPEPGAPDEEIKVHSSISEGSNTAHVSSGEPFKTDESVLAPGQGTAGNIVREGDPAVLGGEVDRVQETASGPPRDVPGPGGLPAPDPDGLRAGPAEGGDDPSAAMGRD